MRKLALALMLVLGLATGIGAQDGQPVEDPIAAKLIVNSKQEIEVGELLVIDVSESTAESFKWIVLPETPDFRIFDQGRTAVFSSRVAGEYLFFVSAAVDDTVDSQVIKVTVKGGQPIVPPTPESTFVAKLKSYCEQVDSPTKKMDAMKLATSFSSVASIMESGTLVTPGEIVTATFKSNQEALGDKLESWRPFREGLATELKALADAGKLPDAKAHIEIWREIAKALNEYADSLQ